MRSLSVLNLRYKFSSLKVKVFTDIFKSAETQYCKWAVPFFYNFSRTAMLFNHYYPDKFFKNIRNSLPGHIYDLQSCIAEKNFHIADGQTTLNYPC